MGIRGLWDVVTPFCERKPLYTLEGQAIAIDLSCWIVEAQTAVVDYSLQGSHLRNIFYRTVQLLTLNVYPVFVLEGAAPTLKYQTIAERNALQQKARPKGKSNVSATKDRTRFHHVLKQCAQMLKFMGLTCVTGKGEAEATCAFLNARQMVAGVISQDSDCFAYGARVVYRNYSKADNKIDVYDMVKAEAALNFGRNKIIVIALFCGSDYNSGVHGVGREAILNFLQDFKDDEVINRIKSWRTNADYYDEWDKKIRDKKNKLIDEKFRFRMKNELQIRSKALKDPNFPDEELINEFLDLKDDIDELDLTWRQPNLISLLKFASKLLGWKEIYTFQKVLPLMTFWQLKNHTLVAEKIARKQLSDFKGVIFPKYIKDRKTLKGVPSYEVVWEDKHHNLDGLIPAEQIETDIESLYTTIEKADLIDEAHPGLVEAFEEELRQKKLEKRKNQRQNNPNKKLRNARKVNKEANPLILTEKIDKIKTVDSFFPKTKVSRLKAAARLDFSFDLNCAGFSDEEDANVSFIVKHIVSRSPDETSGTTECSIPPKSEEFVETETTQTEADYNDLILESNLEFMRERDDFNASSSFFAPPAPDGPFSGDETINYEPDDLEMLNAIGTVKGNEELSSDDLLNDTFDKPYVPLFERIKKKF